MKRFEHGGNIYKIAADLDVDPETLLDFSANINPLGPSRLGLEVMADATKYVTAYPDPNYTQLRHRMADYFETEPGWVIPYNGAIEGLHEVIKYIAPKKTLLFAPTFVEYEKALESIGSQVIRVYATSSTAFKFTEQSVCKALSDSQPDLIIFCTPNNPTGQLLEANIVEIIVKQVETYGTKVVVDEAFIDFTEVQSLIKRLSVMDQKVSKHFYISRSLTKFFGVPGLRLGALITTDQAFLDWRQLNSVPWNVNVFAEFYAYGALSDYEYQSKSRTLIQTERLKLTERLSQLGWLKVFGSEADYLLLQWIGKKPASEALNHLEQHLRIHRILIRRCSNYEGLDTSFFRIAVKSPEANDMLLAAVEAFSYEF